MSQPATDAGSAEVSSGSSPDKPSSTTADSQPAEQQPIYPPSHNPTGKAAGGPSKSAADPDRPKTSQTFVGKDSSKPSSSVFGNQLQQTNGSGFDFTAPARAPFSNFGYGSNQTPNNTTLRTSISPQSGAPAQFSALVIKSRIATIRHLQQGVDQINMPAHAKVYLGTHLVEETRMLDQELRMVFARMNPEDKTSDVVARGESFLADFNTESQKEDSTCRPS